MAQATSLTTDPFLLMKLTHSGWGVPCLEASSMSHLQCPPSYLVIKCEDRIELL